MHSRSPVSDHNRWIAFAALLAFGPAMASADTWQDRPEWAQYFTEVGVAGTIVVHRRAHDSRIALGT